MPQGKPQSEAGDDSGGSGLSLEEGLQGSHLVGRGLEKLSAEALDPRLRRQQSSTSKRIRAVEIWGDS